MSLPPEEDTESDKGTERVYRQRSIIDLRPVKYDYTPIVDDKIPQIPLPISSEYDTIKELYFSKEKVDRSNWTAKLYEEHPEIKETREMLCPVQRAAAFARYYLANDRLLPQPILLSLISQHLRTLGLVETQTSLHSEWDDLLPIPSKMNHSQLTFLIQRGIFHTEKFWELTMPGAPENANAQLNQEISRILGGTPLVHDDSEISLNDEKPGDPKRLIFRDKVTPEEEPYQIRYASLNQIIWICTSDNSYRTDSLVTTTCLMYTSFSDSAKFFRKIKERFAIARKETPISKRDRSMYLTYQFLITWLKESSRQIETTTYYQLQKYIQAEHPNFFPKLTEVIKSIVEERKARAFVNYSNAPPVEFVDDSLWVGEFDIMKLTPREFARQITVFQSKYFFAIERTEFLDTAWERYKHKAPNLVKLVDGEELFVKWATSIVLDSPRGDPKKCLQRMIYLVRTAMELYQMQNFQGVHSIISTFDQMPICHLNSILQDKLDKSMRNWIEKRRNDIMNINENGRAAREVCLAALKTGKPVIPPITIYTRLIGNFTAGYGNKNADGLTDVYKMELALVQIKEVESYQKNRFSFLPVEQAQSFLNNIPEIDYHALIEESYRIIPKKR